MDPNDEPGDIAGHAEAAAGEWRVGVMPDTMIDSLVDEFGNAVAVSAQSPIIVVCPDGGTDSVSKIASLTEIERAIDTTCS